MSVSVEDILEQIKPLSSVQRQSLQSLSDYHQEYGQWPSSEELAIYMFPNADRKVRIRVATTLGRLRKRGAITYTQNTWQLRDPTVIVEARPSEITWLKTIQQWYDEHEEWPTVADLAALESSRVYYQRQEYWKTSFPTLAAYQQHFPPGRFEDSVRKHVTALCRRGYLMIDEDGISIIRYHPTSN